MGARMTLFCVLFGMAVPVSGCVAYTIVDTAVGVTATAVGTTVDVAAGAVDLVIPDGEDEDDNE